jgi:outer membrane protein
VTVGCRFALAFCLLLCSVPSRAEQPLASAPIPISALVQDLIAKGRSGEADGILKPLLAENENDPELLFLSGLIALDRNDPQRAIRAFRKILIDHPKADRVRLELARAFFLAKDYGNAERQFQFASAAHPPAAVQANIDKFLYAIRQEKTLSYSLDLSLAPDTNINGGSASREVTLYGLPFDLSDDAQRHSGVGADISANGEWAPRLGPHSRLRMGLGVQRRDYSGSTFDDMTVAAYAGPRRIAGRWDLSLLGTANRRWYGARPYDLGIGGRITATYHATPRLSVTTDLSVQSVRYDVASYMTGPLASLGETLVYALTPSSGITAKVGASRQSAEADAYSNWSGYVAGGYFRDLPAGFSTYIETSLALASYDEINPAFGVRRADFATTTMVNLLNRHIVLSRFTPRITYSFTHQHSTLPLYSFERNRVEMGLTTTF